MAFTMLRLTCTISFICFYLSVMGAAETKCSTQSSALGIFIKEYIKSHALRHSLSTDLHINFQHVRTVSICCSKHIHVEIDGVGNLSLNKSNIVMTTHNFIQGKYYCGQQQYHSGSTIRRTPTFQVPKKPVINANISETVRIPCRLNGRPGVKYELLWFKDNLPHHTQAVKLSDNSGVVDCGLDLPAVSQDSKGLYQCKVRKIAMTSNNGFHLVNSMPIRLNIAGPPRTPITINMVMDIRLSNETTTHTIHVNSQ